MCGCVHCPARPTAVFAVADQAAIDMLAAMPEAGPCFLAAFALESGPLGGDLGDRDALGAQCQVEGEHVVDRAAAACGCIASVDQPGMVLKTGGTGRGMADGACSRPNR